MADREELATRVEALERENAELRERNDELETKLHAKLEESLSIQARPPRPHYAPGVMMAAGALIGVAGAFASNVLAMLAGLVMLSSGVIWGRQQATGEEPANPEP